VIRAMRLLSFLLATLSLGWLVTLASAQSQFPLENLPYSGGVLAARAIVAGRLTPGIGVYDLTNPWALTCSPAPCVLPNTLASTSGSNPVNEDPIVVNLKNSNQLLTGGNDYNCTAGPSGVAAGFFASSNGGTTWNHTCLGFLTGKAGAGDPGVGYDLRNVAYVIGLEGIISGTSLTPTDVVLEKSTNNGTTWSAVKSVVPPLFVGGLPDKPWLEVDTNANSPHINCLYISLTQFDSSSNSEIAVSHSCDGGKTWTMVGIDPPKQLYPNVDQFSDLAIGKDGTVYASWMRCKANGPTGDCGGTVASMMFSKSTDGGNTWSAPVLVLKAHLTPDAAGCCFYGALPNTGERVSNIPAIGVDNSTGTHANNLYVVMSNWTGTQMQVKVATSTTGGATWKVPVRVAPTSATHDQFFPWLSVNAGGLVGVTWLDRRNDTANISYEAFAAISTNGGVSFGTNHQIATAASNPNNDGFGGAFMGDYTGNYWIGSTLYGSWMDSRGGTVMQDEVGGFLQ
jgi:Neuraminidase (sialidase)